PANGDQAAEQDGSDDTPAIRKARAAVRAARAALEQAIEGNRQIPGSVSGDELEERYLAVELAELRLQAEIEPSPEKDAELNVRYQEAVERARGRQYRRALEANARAPNSVAAPEVERLRLAWEDAKAGVERARAATDSSSEDDFKELQRQIEALRKEVAELRRRVDELTSSASATAEIGRAHV